MTTTLLEKASLQVFQEYYAWKRSLLILDRLESEVFKGSYQKAKIKAGLENAIMKILLDLDDREKDIFKLMSMDYLAYGFECVGMDDVNTEIVELCKDVLDEEVSQKELSMPLQDIPQMEMDEEYIRMGDFSVKRNAYIDKAFHFVSEKEGKDKALMAVLRASLRYASIYSETRHIGPAQVVYDDFYKWGVRNEGFASPFNARLLGKKEAQFYSLFEDTDGIFGSGGSFFLLEKPQNPGHWCLDPPFLKETMDRADGYIGRWRVQYPEISILLIVPAWHQPANQPDETVLLKKGIHHIEGLAGTMNPLPVDVHIHRYGKMEGFSAEAIQQGYLPPR